ncbi:hypothetical protein [Shewanella surugensis]|uniref:Uncharacterized protein n=1 Tax=Shewanella surugensis TaxID=212020 RepID=A0ABT0LAT6_9GAMM|nr:hypothetical protein [Shewanella surugensis]MCL1124281.1 hypothetical protein [Shewanella surugensis]
MMWNCGCPSFGCIKSLARNYAVLSEEHKAYFELALIEEPDPVYMGNFIIRDVELWLS